MLDAENPAQNPAENSAAETAAANAPRSDSSTPAGSGAVGAVGATDSGASDDKAPASKSTAKRAAKKTTKKSAAKRTTKKAAAEPEGPAGEQSQVAGTETAGEPGEAGEPGSTPEAPAKSAAKKTAAKKAATQKTAAKRTTAKRATKKAAAGEVGAAAAAPGDTPPQPEGEGVQTGTEAAGAGSDKPLPPPVLFKAPEPTKAPGRSRKAAEPNPETGESGRAPDKGGKPGKGRKAESEGKTSEQDVEPASTEDESRVGTDEESAQEQGTGRRRRRRGGRRRRKSGGEGDTEPTAGDEPENTAEEPAAAEAESEEGASGTRRRRRRRRAGDEGVGSPDEPENTVVKVRKPRNAEDEITALTGSTRLEAKKQRRREGREAGRRRAPIVSEAEFLARREAVDRVMVIRQRKDLTQIAVMEDKVLVEHYVARESQTSLIGNVYLGRVQNVLPSMEAAFIDIGKGRNAVLYAGEVNWDAFGAKDGQPRRIESVLKSGQSVLVQVTKDPVGHKGARLTSQISLPGRFLVYVPDGTTSGISRKLPDTERNRLKTLLKEIVPDSAGVIVRTAAEGASEDELTRDVERLTARWKDIQGKVQKGNAPQLLYGEPDLTLKVVRDLFTEDFRKLVVAGADAWEMVENYVSHVAPDLADRLEKWDGGEDVFTAYRIDEQIAKALDRKVWLPSGGSLIIDRTEAMTVVDVNTGKFTGSGGNLEETVTKNNLEAAEEIVRQLRLRDIGGIIVVDFIDMVLESNRDLVLRRLVECLGRDRTRHQVAEVTSLGLVQMTRKRIGTGLLEAFSESCEHCQGRGLVVHHEPVEPRKKAEEEPRRGRRGRGRGAAAESVGQSAAPSPRDLAEKAKHEAPAPEGAASSDKAVEQPVQAEKPTVTGEPAGERVAEAGPETADKAEAKPKRKRGAKSAKSAGSQEPAFPAEQPAEAEKPVAPAEQPAEAEKPAEPESAAAQAGEQARAEQSDAEESDRERAPQAPRVVTTVRRRSVATRPAGPPPDAALIQAGPESGPAGTSSGEGASTAEGSNGVQPEGAASAEADGSRSEAPSDAGEPVGAAHVPVKKKGARKR